MRLTTLQKNFVVNEMHQKYKRCVPKPFTLCWDHNVNCFNCDSEIHIPSLLERKSIFQLAWSAFFLTLLHFIGAKDRRKYSHFFGTFCNYLVLFTKLAGFTFVYYALWLCFALHKQICSILWRLKHFPTSSRLFLSLQFNRKNYSDLNQIQ